MLRSLLAVIAAALAGITTAKFVESIGAGFVDQSGALQTGAHVPGAYQGVLVFSWLVSAFIASAIALLIGKRWAPLGAWAAATMLFSSIITQVTFAMSWLMWPVSVIVAGLGGFLAIRLLKAQIAYPGKKSGNSLF